MGRPPKPPELRIADGTHRADRHGDKNAYGSESYIDSMPKCPDGKQPTFRKWWRHYCLAMIKVGQLTERDTSAIEQLCDAHQEVFDAEKELSEAGRYRETPFGISAHPALKTLLLSRKQIQTAQINLGFGAVGRSKVPPRNTTDPKKGVSGLKRKATS